MDDPSALTKLPLEQQVQLLRRRLHRSEQARQEAECLLENRARELDRTNRELREREETLLERLELDNRQLLAAQRTARIATVYRARGEKFAFSPEFRELLGLPAGQVASLDKLRNAIHPLDRRRVERSEFEFYTAAPTDSDHSYEHRILRVSDRSIRWLRWTLRRETDDQGRIARVFGTVQDITEQREASRRVIALRKLADRRILALDKLTAELEASTRHEQQAVSFLRAVLETVPQGIAVFDEDMRLAVWNSPVAGLTEVRSIDLIEGLTFEKFATLHWKHDPAANSDRLHRDSFGKVVKQAFEQLLSDGRIVQVDVIPRQVGGMVKIYTDVSQFKAIEADLRAKGTELTRKVDDLVSVSSELRRSRSLAEQANRSKSQFLAMMSHDIRTPMNGVLGMLDTLSRTELDGSQRKQLNLARESGRQLNVLLSDIIEIVRAEAGKLDLQPEPIDLRQTISGCFAFWQQANTNDAISLRCDIDAGLPVIVMLDPVRIRQLIDNFVSNALKYSGSGEVRLAATHRGPFLRIEVSDDGPGIDKKHQVQLFEDFSRTSSVLAAGEQSAGLGLAICKRVVRAMDGEIGVDSELGKGCCFWAEIPLLRPSQQTLRELAERREEADGRNLTGSRVLVAEDIETNRIVLATMLEQLGCRTTMVEHGKAAVKAVQHGDFDFVLMDVNMPVMDGREATRRIRKLKGEKARIPIIGVTAHVLQEDREELLAAGMDALVAKPVSLDALKAGMGGVAVHAGRAQPIAKIQPLLDEGTCITLFDALPADRRERVLNASLNDLSSLGADYATAQAAGDEDGMRRAAHSFKGVAGNIGAVRLAAMLDERGQVDPGDLQAVVADTIAALRDRFAISKDASGSQ